MEQKRYTAVPISDALGEALGALSGRLRVKKAVLVRQALRLLLAHYEGKAAYTPVPGE